MAKTDGTRKLTPGEAKAMKKRAEQDRQLEDSRAHFARPLHEFPELEDVLPDLCTRYREIVAEAKALEAERQELSSVIMPLLEAVEWNSIQGDTWNAVRSRGSRKSLSPEKLVEQGVTFEQLAAATVTKEYWYIQVREPKALEPGVVDGE